MNAPQSFQEPSVFGVPIKLTTSLPLKVMGSSVLALLGVYYLARGKQNGEARSMVLGAFLVIVAFLIF